MPANVSLTEVIFALVLLALAGYVLIVVLSYGLPLMVDAARDFAQQFAALPAMNAARASSRQRHRKLRQEIDHELGRAGFWKDPEEDVIRAAHDAQTIAAIDRKLRASVRQCHATHWGLVKAMQSESMTPAASHPLCQSYRLRIIDLTQVLAEEINTYPLLSTSPELVALAFGARRLGSVCASCPYFASSIYDAPRPCPSVKAVTDGERHQATSVKDGEIIE